MSHDRILILDFGSQVTQLIARRVREAGVYSELVPHSMPVDELLAKDPKAIILSGGPASVFEPGAPTIDSKVFESGVPVLGICYGFQVMAYELGGKVDKAALGEYGKTSATIDAAAGIGEAFALATCCADRAVVVTTNAPSRLRDAQRTVMELRHIDCKKWERICKEVHMSRSRVNDYYNAALDTILSNKRAQKLVQDFEQDRGHGTGGEKSGII